MSTYPRVYGKGALFCYSGLCGDCTPGDDLVGTLTGDHTGVSFERGALTLSLFFRGVREFHYDAVASDAIRGTVSGKAFSLFFTAQHSLLLTYPSEHVTPVLRVAPDLSLGEDGTVSVGGRVFCFRQATGKAALCVADTPEKAAERANAALAATVTVEDALSFFDALPCPPEGDDALAELLAKCFSVMKSQVYTPIDERRTRWTTPDRTPHRDIWLWDSVFHSVGNRYLSPALAADTLRSVAGMQREDGFIPHMAGRRSHSDVTQPPILAWGVEQYYEATHDFSLVSELYPSIIRFVEWIRRNRDANGNDLYEWYVHRDSVICRCGESGMDNSPRFDGVAEMDCIDFSCYMASEARSLCRLAKELEMPADAARWDALYERIKAAINRVLWCETDGMYYDYDPARGDWHRVAAVSSFLPLFAGVCPPERARRLIDALTDPARFGTALPIPSVSRCDPTFGDDMWRGPVWINMNYMILRGLSDYGYTDLAADIRAKTLACVLRFYENDGVLYEFYDPSDRLSPSRMNRKGPAIIPPQPAVRMPAVADYGWTAALVAAMILN